VLHARRLVAQRCIYGVDKNELAVNLARLSLWLATFAKDHPFTFVDHALRRGDSLVGLSREQIVSFSWDVSRGKQVSLVRTALENAVSEAETLRAQIHALGDTYDNAEKERLLREADDALRTVRRVGNVILEAFFAGKSAKERDTRLKEYRASVEQYGLDRLPATPESDRHRPFHWEIEFPEVFGR
ncbi:MAG: hypothetical protein ABSC94_33735, partial [Polyangiaceae bacterium]|jgi:hypothetical protein